MEHSCPLPRCHTWLQTPFYQTYHLRNTQGFRHPSPTHPSSRLEFNVNQYQQTHPLQTNRSFYTFICCPRLEQYIILQLLSSARLTVCLRVIGNYPRRTPIPLLHSNLNIPPIWEFIYLLHPSPTLPSSRSEFNVNPYQQTHPLQTNHSFYTFICRPRLEQHIILQLLSSARLTV